jgi:transcriptional regulator PpsR
MLSSSGGAAATDLGVFSPLAGELAQTVILLDGDIALVLDAAGTITRVACGDDEPLTLDAHRWVGRPWIETVSSETRPKVERLLAEVAGTGRARRGQVNHPARGGPDIPVSYAAVRLGAQGPVLAVGRDLRPLAALQQRFVEVQSEIERGYWRTRQAQTQHERLFHAATDAVATVDATTKRIVGANAASARLFARPPPQPAGEPVEALFDELSRGAVVALIGSAAAGTPPGEIRARAAWDRAPLAVAATRLPCGHVLVRARAVDADPGARDAAFVALLEPRSDAVLVTDVNGRVLAANPAFVHLVHAAHDAQVLGRPLADWVGRDGALVRLLERAANEGIAPAEPTTLRAIGGASVDAELAATLMPDGDQAAIGIVLRRRPAAGQA